MELKPRVLPEKTIHIWHCNFDYNRDKITKYSALLSKDEQQKASRFKFKKDEDCYIITRGILRLLLASYLKVEVKEIAFKYTSFGKPLLAMESQLKFNVSHSGDLAAFAFCHETEVGIDIEKIKTNFDVLELAQNFFSKNEIIALEKQPKEEQVKAFYRCWTRKESFIKAEGSGLSFPLNKFTVSLNTDYEASLLETHWDSAEKENWRLFSFLPGDSYIGALAVRNKFATINYFNWDRTKSPHLN